MFTLAIAKVSLALDDNQLHVFMHATFRENHICTWEVHLLFKSSQSSIIDRVKFVITCVILRFKWKACFKVVFYSFLFSHCFVINFSRRGK
jgi:hypothetical protein